MSNIIFIVVDALTADHLGCYGYHRDTSPNIDRLAKEGILFKNAYATTNATDPSFSTILSGKYPLSHGLIHHGSSVTQKEITQFEKGTKLLPEFLKTKGYISLG